MRKAVITGMGAISPCGQTAAESFASLVAARSGIAPVTTDVFPAPNSLVAGQITFDPAAYPVLRQPAPLDRATQFALVAVEEAMADARIALSDEDQLRAGVYWGTGLGGATSIEEAYRGLFASARGRVRPATVVLGMSNSSAAHVSMAHGLRGPQLNFSTACSSSAVAIGEACRAIRDGYADVIVAGGSEALITYANLTAWEAMRALAHADVVHPSRSCKPFSADRAGLVLGEGAAAVVIESAEHAARRGARVHAEIAGYGNAGDACSISRPDAAGQVRAMRIALAEAGMDTGEIGYINAHATGTPLGDQVETTAIKTVFGDDASRLCVSSTKALHGHLLGAAGALELVIGVMALTGGVVPPTAHLVHPDPACDLDYVPNEARRVPLTAVMSNSFGFGGMNAVLIVRRH